MTPTITVDTKPFLHDMRVYAAATGKTLKWVIKDEARLFVKALIKMTPPFEISNPVDGSYAAQLRLMKEVIKRQAGSRFLAIKKFKIEDKKVRKQVRFLTEMGFIGAVQKIFEKHNLRVQDIRSDLGERRYNSQRNRWGRILGKDVPPILITSQQPINEMVKLKWSHIGKAKGGWVKAANALGLNGVPNWITTHNAYGHFKVASETETGVVYEVGNFVPFIQKAGSKLKIVAGAIKFRERRFKDRLEKALKYGHK